MDKFPECPHCGHEHSDHDWLYNNNGYVPEDETNKVKCDDCGKEFFFRVFMVPMYESHYGEELL